MNKFSYEASISEIKEATTLKKLESIIRYNLPYKAYKQEVDLQQIVYSHHLATAAYEKFTDKTDRKLPTFISTYIMNTQRSLITFLRADKCSLEQLLDVFKYDTEVAFVNSNDNIEYFQSIVKDTKLPFSLNIEEELTIFEIYAFTPNYPKLLALTSLHNLVKYTRLKQVHANKEDNYLLDLNIKNSKEQVYTLGKEIHQDYITYLKTSEKLLKQHIRAVTATKKYLKGLIDESNNNNTEELKSSN